MNKKSLDLCLYFEYDCLEELNEGCKNMIGAISLTLNLFLSIYLQLSCLVCIHLRVLKEFLPNR